MKFKPEELSHLRTWLSNEIVMQPECTADPDILADSILGVLQVDHAPTQLQNECTSELASYLKAGTPNFVRKLFSSLSTRSYMGVAASAPAVELPGLYEDDDGVGGGGGGREGPASQERAGERGVSEETDRERGRARTSSPPAAADRRSAAAADSGVDRGRGGGGASSGDGNRDRFRERDEHRSRSRSPRRGREEGARTGVGRGYEQRGDTRQQQQQSYRGERRDGPSRALAPTGAGAHAGGYGQSSGYGYAHGSGHNGQMGQMGVHSTWGAPAPGSSQAWGGGAPALLHPPRGGISGGVASGGFGGGEGVHPYRGGGPVYPLPGQFASPYPFQHPQAYPGPPAALRGGVVPTYGGGGGVMSGGIVSGGATADGGWGGLGSAATRAPVIGSLGARPSHLPAPSTYTSNHYAFPAPGTSSRPEPYRGVPVTPTALIPLAAAPTPPQASRPHGHFTSAHAGSGESSGFRQPTHGTSAAGVVGVADTGSNRTLLVSHIPPSLSSIAALSTHFAQFGSVTNVLMRPEVQQSLITYATHEEAQAALDSGAPVCGDGSIEVGWGEHEGSSRPHYGAHRGGGGGGGGVGMGVGSVSGRGGRGRGRGDGGEGFSGGGSESYRGRGRGASGSGAGRGGPTGAYPYHDSSSSGGGNGFEHPASRVDESPIEAAQRLLAAQKEEAAKVSTMIARQKAMMTKLTAIKGTLSKEQLSEMMGKIKQFAEAIKMQQQKLTSAVATAQRSIASAHASLATLMSQDAAGTESLSEEQKLLARMGEQLALYGDTAGGGGGGDVPLATGRSASNGFGRDEYDDASNGTGTGSGGVVMASAEHAAEDKAFEHFVASGDDD